uniref:Si:ch73-109d9.3 n=1 Tax=Electrophorus electricus TaxID=8005 RepID=A0AAY5F381_ELEEL
VLELFAEIYPHTVKQLASSSDSLAIKQEVVVVLPPEWEDVEKVRSETIHNPSRVNRAQEELQHGDPLPIRSAVEGGVMYIGPCGNVEDLASDVAQKLGTPGQTPTKLVEREVSVLPSNPGTTNVARGQSIHKSPPVPKPPQALQHFQRAYTDERTISALQSGRNLTQTFSIRTHGHAGHHVVRAPHSCTQCGKGFSHLCHLRAHQQIHTGERQFCCSLCGRSFTKLSNLKAHRRVHTGERPYICMDCGKRFTQKCNLKRHQRIHSPHCCVYCGKSFAQVGHLKVHMLSHQGKKPLSCSQCNKTFVHNFELKDHYQRQHSGERPHVCHVCGKGFTSLHNLNIINLNSFKIDFLPEFRCPKRGHTR